MNQLVELVEKKMNINTTNIKIPYFLGILFGYFFDFYSKVSSKEVLISSVRVKKFCATTKYSSLKLRKKYKAPFTLEQGLNKTLEHEFINTKNDNILFFSE